MNNIKMLYYDRIAISKGTDVNKTSKSKECDICHCWYFLNKGFKFQPNLCNGYYELLMISMTLAILPFSPLKILIIAVLLVELAKIRP